MATRRTSSLHGTSRPSSHVYSGHHTGGTAHGLRVSNDPLAPIGSGDSIPPSPRANSRESRSKPTTRDTGTGPRTPSRTYCSAGPDLNDTASRSVRSRTPEFIKRALIATGVFDGTEIDLQKHRFHPEGHKSSQKHSSPELSALGRRAISPQNASEMHIIRYRDVGTLARQTPSPSPATISGQRLETCAGPAAATEISGIAPNPPETDIAQQLRAEDDGHRVNGEDDASWGRLRRAALAYVPQHREAVEQPEAPARPESPKSRRLHLQTVVVEPTLPHDQGHRGDFQAPSLRPDHWDLGRTAPEMYPTCGSLGLGLKCFGESSSEYVSGIFSHGGTGRPESGSSLHDIPLLSQTANHQGWQPSMPFSITPASRLGHTLGDWVGPAISPLPVPGLRAPPRPTEGSTARHGVEGIVDYIDKIEQEVLGRTPEDDGRNDAGLRSDDGTDGVRAYDPSPSLVNDTANSVTARALSRPRSQQSRLRGVTRTPLGPLSTKASTRTVCGTPGSAPQEQTVLETLDEDGGGLTMSGFWRPNRFTM